MTLHFSKFQGTGNDFIILDNRHGKIAISAQQIQHLCDRHFGIGADGLIMAEIAESGQLFMRYYNADGFEASMCGNGGRCLAAWAVLQGIGENEITLEARDGLHFAIVEALSGGIFYVNLTMNDVTTFKKHDDAWLINTGVPHLVKFCNDPDQIDVFSEGRRLRFDPQFQPEGVNVNFASIERNEIFVRTYERGVEDETLSCGTGVTATAIAAMLQRGLKNAKWDIFSKGGRLSVTAAFNGKEFHDITLEGPAQFVFKGQTEIPK